MVWKGFKDVRATIQIDLSKTEEELWMNLESTARKNVKRANTYNLVLKESEEWEKFYPYYSATWARGGVSPEPIEEMKKDRKLFLAYYGEEVAGGGVVEIENGVLEFFAIAVGEKYLEMQAYAFIYWNLILWSKRNGLTTVDLGGYQLGTKVGEKLYYVNRFKEKWGGELKLIPVYSWNPFYILGRKAIRNSAMCKWIWDRIKGRPLPQKKEYTRE
jgi:lipid II:glycine glycyltransferase (peptidoglycan interpeptide bridge formation enzyme)